MGLTLGNSLNVEVAGGAAGLSETDVNALIQGSTAWEYITTYEITAPVVHVEISGSDTLDWNKYEEIWITGKNIINDGQVTPSFKLNNYSCYYINRYGTGPTTTTSTGTNFTLPIYYTNHGYNFDVKVRYDGINRASMDWNVTPTEDGRPNQYCRGYASTTSADAGVDSITLNNFRFIPDAGKEINIYGLRKRTT